jgi:hypothetical protein
MLVEDLFEQEEGFPQTWGPQEGLVDFVGGQPLVVAADDAGFLGEAEAAQRFDLAGAAFMPHLIAKKGLVVTAELPEEEEQEQAGVPEAEDLARYLPVTKPTVDVAYSASTSSHSLLDGADFALDLAAFDAQAPALPPLELDEDAGSVLGGADGATRDEQRKQRNRESAARSRKRTRERMAYLENLVDHLMKKNRRLEVAVQQLSGGAAVARMASLPVAAPVYAPGMMLGAPSAVSHGGDDMFRLAC